jgi:hypothetical protein
MRVLLLSVALVACAFAFTGSEIKVENDYHGRIVKPSESQIRASSLQMPTQSMPRYFQGKISNPSKQPPTWPGTDVRTSPGYNSEKETLNPNIHKRDVSKLNTQGSRGVGIPSQTPLEYYHDNTETTTYLDAGSHFYERRPVRLGTQDRDNGLLKRSIGVDSMGPRGDLPIYKPHSVYGRRTSENRGHNRLFKRKIRENQKRTNVPIDRARALELRNIARQNRPNNPQNGWE